MGGTGMFHILWYLIIGVLVGVFSLTPGARVPSRGMGACQRALRSAPRKKPNDQIPENVKHACASHFCLRSESRPSADQRSLPPLSQIELWLIHSERQFR